MADGFTGGPALDADEILDGEKRKYGYGEKGPDSYEEREYILPDDYGGTKITLLVQNPNWVFVMWEFGAETKARINSINSTADAAAAKGLCVRMYYADTDRYFDTEIKLGARSWYIHVPETNRPYYAEIGVMDNDNRFTAIARSNAVVTPADSAAGSGPDGKPADPELFNMSGGEWVGKTPGSLPGGK
ncbi:MAG: DUF4912 domain-containing protein [Brevinematales bacterium]|jgi:hypothetical protein